MVLKIIFVCTVLFVALIDVHGVMFAWNRVRETNLVSDAAILIVWAMQLLVLILALIGQLLVNKLITFFLSVDENLSKSELHLDHMKSRLYKMHDTLIQVLDHISKTDNDDGSGADIKPEPGFIEVPANYAQSNAWQVSVLHAIHNLIPKSAEYCIIMDDMAPTDFYIGDGFMEGLEVSDLKLPEAYIQDNVELTGFKKYIDTAEGAENNECLLVKAYWRESASLRDVEAKIAKASGNLEEE